MTIEWKDPHIKLHGKRRKGDSYYFRWHYGKQRMVHISCAYVDKPTEKQKSAREAFTALRKEVARQLQEPTLRARWEARFKKDKEGYKMLHTYVYAKLKAGETVTQLPTCRGAIHRVSMSKTSPKQETQYIASLLVVYDHTIIPIFLPNKVPKRENIEDLDVNEKNSNFADKIICL